MTRFNKPNVPFVEAAHKGGHQRPTLIVLQSSFTSSLSGAALAMAHHMHRSISKESYHYILDEAFVYRMVHDDRVAMYAPDSKHTIGILICDDPSGPSSRWDDRHHIGLMSKMADLVAQLCLAYGIKPRFLTNEDLSRWKKWRIKRRGGIVTNGFMNKTYWPEEYFLALVKANIEKHKAINK